VHNGRGGRESLVYFRTCYKEEMLRSSSAIPIVRRLEEGEEQSLYLLSTTHEWKTTATRGRRSAQARKEITLHTNSNKQCIYICSGARSAHGREEGCI